MSSDPEVISELCKEAVSLHSVDSLEECTMKLDIVREKLMNIDRGKLDLKVLWNLCGLLKAETLKWTEECHPSVNSLEVSAQALFCLRNTFVNCSKTQLMVAETDDLRDVILTCVKWVFLSKHEKDGDALPRSYDDHPPEGSEWFTKLSQLAKASITCLGNLVAANTTTRKIIWPHLKPHLSPLLCYSEVTISYLSSMVIFNCLLEEEIRKDLSSCGDVDDVISDLLTLYLGGVSSNEKTLCFVLFVLEILLCCDREISNVWPRLSRDQQVLLLDILSNILEGKSSSKCGTMPSSSATFFTGLFKSEADKILRTFASKLEDGIALVVPRLLDFLCLLAVSDYWGPTLREDKSLLITTVSLLQSMNDIGNIASNEFSRMGLDELANEEKLERAETHPAYGFKRDLIRLIASLVYRHKTNQDQVREMGGVTLILESSQFNAKNPGIKEASIYAIRNLLEGNPENQQVVKNLEYRGSAENQSMQLTRQNGMVVVQGPPPATQSEENL